MSLSACGSADGDGDRAAGTPDAITPEAGTPEPSPTPSPALGGQDAGGADGTPIRITFGDTELTARLDDNATARDLATQLPLTLTFRDHNNVEKTAPLARELSLDDAPEGHDPAAGDIGYFAPGGDLVLYYDRDARHRAHRRVRRRRASDRAAPRGRTRHSRTRGMMPRRHRPSMADVLTRRDAQWLHRRVDAAMRALRAGVRPAHAD
jgi:hypothetical protein